MTQEHHGSLKQYVNDMLALERDIANAVAGQLGDDRVAEISGLPGILGEITGGSESRMERLKAISEAEGASLGAAIKEGVTAVSGVLAGLYGKVREHPVSRMVRDDIVALNLCATAYGMLLTLGLAAGHNGVASLAEEGLKAAAKLVMKLTPMLPEVVASELAKDGPLANPAAVQLASEKIIDAWS